MVLFIMLYKVGLTFMSVDKTLINLPHDIIVSLKSFLFIFAIFFFMSTVD